MNTSEADGSSIERSLTRLTQRIATSSLIILFVTFFSPLSQLPPAHAATACSPSLTFQTTSGDANNVGSMQYSLIARNTGSTTCNGASISVYYADNETYVSGAPKPVHGYYWKLGNLTPNQTITITLTTSRTAPVAEADATNQACLMANNGTDACTSSPVSAPSAPVTTPPPPTPTPTPVPPPPVISTPTSTPTSTPVAPSVQATSTAEYGVWEWTLITQMNQQKMQSDIANAKASGFNVIYLTIDDYLSIDTMPAGVAKQQALATYENALNAFLTLAAQNGIAIDAESGASDWAFPGNTWKPSDIMSFVANYNQSHAIEFRGVQYDIEPYTTLLYNIDPGTVLTQYTQMVESLVNQDKSLGLPLELVIPHFYDSIVGWTPQITVDSITAYPYDHLLRLMNQIPNGKFYVMAYRNFANGTNGTIALSQTEIQQADSTGVKVIVAQETGNVLPSYVTFFGTSKSTLASQVAIVNNAFENDTSFDGIAVDYLDPFLQLP